MSGETKAAAHGRWREILPALGIETKFLVNRHGPCPVCGGRDRFRFDDRGGHGTYFCSQQCGPGDGITLLRRFHSWSYAEACQAVDKVIGCLQQRSRRTATSQRNETDWATCLGRLRTILDEANQPIIVENYLLGRGITVVPDILRGHPQLKFYNDERQFAGYHPATVAPVLDENGELRNVHRTYITESRHKKISTKMAGFRNLAVRLFEPDDVLGVAEGIETSIAAYELFGVPVWSVINTINMTAWRPPKGIRSLRIFGDNDASFAGQLAAYTLANALAVDRKREIRVEVHIPPKSADWLDVLNERA